MAAEEDLAADAPVVLEDDPAALADRIITRPIIIAPIFTAVGSRADAIITAAVAALVALSAR